MALKLKIFNFLFVLLIFSGTIPIALAAGGDNGGGGDAVQLDYDAINEFEEEELSVTKNPQNFIDLESLDEPIEYRVAIWLNNVGKIEKESGVYELDFWYTISSDDVNFLEIGIPPVTFTNSKVTHLESDYMEEHYYEVRVRGTFFNVLDWSLFPFEKIELNVEIDRKKKILNSVGLQEEVAKLESANDVITLYADSIVDIGIIIRCGFSVTI